MLSTRKPISKSIEGNNAGFSGFFKVHYHSIISSKIPTYCCVLIYVGICLLGNVVTGMIWLKHHEDQDNEDKEIIISTHLNESIMSFMWNDTTKFNDIGLDYDEETKGLEVFNILQFRPNTSTDSEQVSLYLLKFIMPILENIIITNKEYNLI